MDKKEAFKEFLRQYPKLTEYLKNHTEMNMQKFYEIYDIYGESSEAWSPYLKESSTNKVSFKDLMGSIDTDMLQEHIKTAQKALGFIEEITTKGAENLSNIPKGPTSPRPINKFFGD